MNGSLFRLGTLTALLLAGCGAAPKAGPSPATPVARLAPAAPAASGVVRDSGWAHRWWLEKTVRTLRAGEGFGPGDDVKALLALPREKVVAQLVADPRFADMVLAYNLSFFGMRKDRIRKENGDYEDEVYNFPQAISAARAILTGGDYLQILDLYQPPYFGPMPRPLTPDLADDTRDPDLVRQRQFTSMQKGLRAIIAEASAEKPPSLDALCNKFRRLGIDGHAIGARVGLPRYVAIAFMMSRDWYGLPKRMCLGGEGTPSELADALRVVVKKNELLFSRLLALEPSVRRPKDPTAIATLDPSGLEPGFKFNQMNFLNPGTIINSNTNYNRKRANYFLRRYFCDNLTPVGVEMPAHHAEGRHASDPACLSCHYKLDPMGGFFRYYGIGWENFEHKRFIVFDDRVRSNLEDYVQNWKAPAGSGREWNVGYIRSVRDEKLNDYGSSMEDLFRIFRRAPEVKHCLVQRMYEFLVSDHQAVDGDYLDFLTDEFTKNLKKNSTGAVKTLVSRIVLGEGFSSPVANPGECYDYRPGTKPSPDSPPCRIASILKHRCTACHHSVHDAPFLDLAHFKRLENGERSFPHYTENGKVVGRARTLGQIAERLMTADPDERMPYLSDMPTNERQALYSWADDEEAK